jgi:CheY-like chemotaxis protein
LLSLVRIPIPANGKVIGAINVASKKRSVISSSEVDTLLSIVQETGIGIMRIRSEDVLKRSEDTLKIIIDVELEILSMLKNILEDSGYTIHTSEYAKQGILLYEEKQGEINLVILDIVMPDMSGREAFEKLRTIDPDMRILIASGYSEEEQHHDLIKMGAAGFIGKPFMEDTLLKIIREAFYSLSCVHT